MKRLFLFLIIIFSVSISAFCQPQISFEEKSKDLEFLLWRNPVEVEYKFTNTGDKPLMVSNVTVSCGCMEAKWTTDPILPGEKGTITATFDTEALGKFYKEVGVYCNASTLPVYLDFSGEVTASPKDYVYTHKYGFGAVRLNKNEILFDDVSRGETPEMEIMVANTSAKSSVPVLMHLPPYLNVRMEPQILGKFQTGKIYISLDTKKLPRLGITRTSVYLSRFPGDKVSKDNEIPVSVVLLPELNNKSGNVKPMIELSSKEIDLKDVKPGKKKSQTIVITNKGNANLEILDLQVFSMALNVDVNRSVLKPGEQAKMKVTVRTDRLMSEKKDARILMITNDPQQPKVTVTVKAISEVKAE